MFINGMCVGKGNRVSGSTFGNSIFGNTTSTNMTSTFISGNSKGILIKGDGTYIIDGKEYKADEISIRTEYKIKATGETVYTEPEHVKLELRNAENTSVSVSSESGNIEISCEKPCEIRNAQSTSGDVNVEGNAKTVSSISGNVRITGSVSGSASSVSGNVYCKNRG
jgi:hypothetical protein